MAFDCSFPRQLFNDRFKNLSALSKIVFQIYLEEFGWIEELKSACAWNSYYRELDPDWETRLVSRKKLKDILNISQEEIDNCVKELVEYCLLEYEDLED